MTVIEEYVTIADQQLKKISKTTSNTSSNCSSLSSKTLVATNTPNTIKTNVISLENCSVTYFSDHFADKFTKQFNCNGWDTNPKTKKYLNDKTIKL